MTRKLEASNQLERKEHESYTLRSLLVHCFDLAPYQDCLVVYTPPHLSLLAKPMLLVQHIFFVKRIFPYRHQLSHTLNNQRLRYM